MRKLRVLAVLVLVAAVVVMDVFWVRGLQHWLAYQTGSRNTPVPPHNYNFFSGFGSIILPPFLNAGALGAVYVWHHNCHHKGCWRISKHQVNGTSWCSHHHEDARAAVTPLPVTPDEKFNKLIESVDGLAEAIRAALLTRPKR